MKNTEFNGKRIDAGKFALPCSPTDGNHPELGFKSTPDMDPADYLPEMEEFDLSEAQKAELLETLWNIMGSIARLGFHMDVCGLIFEEFNEAAAPESGNGKLLPATTVEMLSKNHGKEGSE